MNQLVAHTDAITGLQNIVGGVSEDINSFKSSFSGPSDLASSHGTIGFPMQNALDGASSARNGALGATQVAASRMSELLGKASQAYARGDLDAAERLKAQADALGGGKSAAGGGAGGSEAASSGAGGAGQVMGQFSQMPGQMMQSVTQPLQGLAQAVTQVPQQAMQGVQGIVEAAMQAGGGGGEAALAAGGTGAEEAVKAADHQGAGDGRDDAQDGEKKDDADHRKHEGERAPVAEAGTAAERSYEQLAGRAWAGATAEDGFGVGPVPTQVHNINPRRQ